MATWIGPVLKALPHLAAIATATAQAFTRRKGTASEPDLTHRQIAELQTAASETDARLRELATEAKEALSAIEKGVFYAERRFHRLYRLCIATLCVAVLALVVAVFAFFSR